MEQASVEQASVEQASVEQVLEMAEQARRPVEDSEEIADMASVSRMHMLVLVALGSTRGVVARVTIPAVAEECAHN